MTKSTTIVFAIIGVLVLGVIVFLTYPKSTIAPTDGVATTTGAGTSTAATGSTTGKPKPAPAATTGVTPSIGLSKVLIKDASGVSLYAGLDTIDRPVYKLVPGIDAATFKALTELDAVEHPTQKKNGTVTSLGVGSVAYYKDKNFVYVLSVFENGRETQAAIQVIQDADLASFAPLANPWYAKDKTHVFRLEAPTTDTHDTGTYVWHSYDMAVITNADPASFTLVSNASLTYDAHDKTHKYRKGLEVGTYPE